MHGALLSGHRVASEIANSLMGPFWEKNPKIKNNNKCPRGCNYEFKIHESVFDHVADKHALDQSDLLEDCMESDDDMLI